MGFSLHHVTQYRPVCATHSRGTRQDTQLVTDFTWKKGHASQCQNYQAAAFLKKQQPYHSKSTA